MTYRSGCPRRFQVRCRTQPINTGIKLVSNRGIQKAIAFWSAMAKMWDFEHGDILCPTLLLGNGLKHGITYYSEAVQKKRRKHERDGGVHDLLCEQAAVFNTIQNSTNATSRIRWGHFSRTFEGKAIHVKHPKQEGEVVKVNLGLLPCSAFNAVLVGAASAT
ncbi:hypothetical protein CYMTET_15463 [Cymbomonas tetramitiformis]|uniref:Uncharacterized protein n=1 Tax=Cymbomonas tetramitiformis TaxID=36881 RepID=A0AAE0GEI6_9CHLO|nr:hypothetical protein CYMTET_15463 [Cymbomonas tetramitiformis]